MGKEIPTEREVMAMALKHKVVINVSDSGGRKRNVLKGAEIGRASCRERV